MTWIRNVGRQLGGAVAAALLLAGCGGSQTASTDPGPRPDLVVDDPTTPNPLPPVTVWDVGQKKWVQFANFLPADKPVLVWLWAPH